jgi:hypothetical protein
MLPICLVGQDDKWNACGWRRLVALSRAKLLALLT